MSRASFFDLVIRLRYNQHMYYKTRGSAYSNDASDLELKVYEQLKAGQEWIDANPDLAEKKGSSLNFFRLVGKMCHNRRLWYDSHERQYLLESIALEKRVDAELPNEYAQLRIASKRYDSYLNVLAQPRR